jgi:site-specific recombinase XerD
VRGKGGHERVLPVMAETLDCLDAYLGEHPCSAGPLIRSYRSWERHQALSAGAISKYVSIWMNDAGIKTGPRDGISAHAGRHTCATDMLRTGAHLRDVQAVLGHAHLSTSETYLPLLVNGLESAMTGRSYRTNWRP